MPPASSAIAIASSERSNAGDDLDLADVIQGRIVRTGAGLDENDSRQRQAATSAWNVAATTAQATSPLTSREK